MRVDALLFAVLLTGCAADPPPRVAAQDLTCLSDAYWRVLERDVLRSRYDHKLEAVIEGYREWAEDANAR